MTAVLDAGGRAALSELYHAALIDRQADAARVEALIAAGFVVVEIWDVQVWHDPKTVVDLVRKGEQISSPG
jgi:very-short-patch-repair endonuclease